MEFVSPFAERLQIGRLLLAGTSEDHVLQRFACRAEGPDKMIGRKLKHDVAQEEREMEPGIAFGEQKRRAVAGGATLT
jgi:hypothetical protein